MMKAKAVITREVLFEDLPYSVIWLDEIGKVVFANNKLDEKLGDNNEKIIKLPIFNIKLLISAKI